MTEKLVYDYTMEALLRVLGQPLTAEHLTGLRALGVDPRQFQPAYPADTYTQVLNFIVAELWPQLPREEAGFELGRAFMRAYQQTAMGKAVAAVTRVIGPHRSLERMSRNFRSANNFTETKLNKVGPNHYELWFNHARHTNFFRGLLTEALTRTGAREVSVTLLTLGEATEATFHITWSQ
ncbi:DUF2378 family protein [Cystobacter ferrugineus]|uniref:DUF2378 family protein n=1 Tax=Cystobacter ferrugineus TaxID=83449 RepID=A0A1L9B820_9BACT|nr:DUF2378 family protein [Cystobacter ferrugineus]OJH38407.1 hypothetical protein BON30_25120 [Cystobacter ferrugineus]